MLAGLLIAAFVAAVFSLLLFFVLHARAFLFLRARSEW